jgi:hypothetical protein
MTVLAGAKCSDPIECYDKMELPSSPQTRTMYRANYEGGYERHISLKKWWKPWARMGTFYGKTERLSAIPDVIGNASAKRAP